MTPCMDAFQHIHLVLLLKFTEEILGIANSYGPEQRTVR